MTTEKKLNAQFQQFPQMSQQLSDEDLEKIAGGGFPEEVIKLKYQNHVSFCKVNGLPIPSYDDFKKSFE